MRLKARQRVTPELPGVTGRARVDRRARGLLRVLLPGDIAVLNAPDLDARMARSLIDTAVGAVVNTAPFSTGRFPNLGPRLLADAGVMMVECAPEDAHRVRDGAEVRLHAGVLYDAEGQHLLAGQEIGPDDVDERLARARAQVGPHLQGIAPGAEHLLRDEQDLFLQGVGLPTLGGDLRRRPALVVGSGHHPRELHRIHGFVREQRPVVIAVDSAARDLLARRLRPDVVVVSGDRVSKAGPLMLNGEDLRHVGELVVHSPQDRREHALDQLQSWRVPAHAVVSDASTDDIALLLAYSGGASLVVGVGCASSMEEVLARADEPQASAVLTRLRLGPTLVDSTVVERLYGGRVRSWHLWLIVAVALVALWLSVATTPIGNVWWDAVGSWIGSILDTLPGGPR